MDSVSSYRKAAIYMICWLTTQLAGCAIHTSADRKMNSRSYTILAMGDSITEGGPLFASYLHPLDSMLRGAGYHYRFIGPRSSVRQGDTIYHAGFSGKNAEFLARLADSIYNVYPADIVLLHTGHNHFVEEAPVPGIIAAQRAIIRTMKARNPSVVIMVAAVITAGKLPKYEYIPALNIAIRNMVDSLHDPSVVLVDQEPGWDWSRFTIDDKVHPNPEGAVVIAGKWMTAFNKLYLKNK